MSRNKPQPCSEPRWLRDPSRTVLRCIQFTVGPRCEQVPGQGGGPPCIAALVYRNCYWRSIDMYRGLPFNRTTCVEAPQWVVPKPSHIPSNHCAYSGCTHRYSAACGRADSQPPMCGGSFSTHRLAVGLTGWPEQWKG